MYVSNLFVIFLLVSITSSTVYGHQFYPNEIYSFQETNNHHVQNHVHSVQELNTNYVETTNESKEVDKVVEVSSSQIMQINYHELIQFVENTKSKLATLENENQKMKEQIQILLLRQDNTIEKLKNVDNVAQNAQSVAYNLGIYQILKNMFE
jgi:hypothetical protein